ncbi:MAG: FixH family protein [Polyangiaceae bacterium]
MRSLCLLMLLGLVGCGGDDGSSGGGSGGTSALPCAGRGETFAAGMAKEGASKQLSFTLMSSDPAPPQLFDNTWRVRVEEGSQPLTGATLTVKTWMPDHDHASPKKTSVTEASDGQYDLSPVNLFMPGLWEITVQAKKDSTEDEALFSFCIGE